MICDLSRRFGRGICAALFSLATAAACAQPDACPAEQVDVQRANRDALALFARLAINPAAVGQPQSAASPGSAQPEAFGALGDGRADDTAALQRALDQGGPVWLGSGRIYRFTHRLELRTGNALASDGTATLLMAGGAEGFSNQQALRTAAGIYSARGTGLRVQGADVSINDISIVKTYEDDRYVIGIDVMSSQRVSIRRVRLRGFSIAPGIVTIRSSDDVTVHSTLIHASCTQSTHIPDDVPSFQITGISVDDSRVGGRGSTRLQLTNNVIVGVHMVPLTERREQSDGINFAAIGTGQGSVIDDNFISGVDEGLDLWGGDMEVRHNRVSATGTTLKLVHGAHDILVFDNTLTQGPDGVAVGIYTARPAEQQRQVRNITLRRNHVQVSEASKTPIRVDHRGDFPPVSISLLGNDIFVQNCQQPVIDCPGTRCTLQNNRRRLRDGSGDCAP